MEGEPRTRVWEASILPGRLNASSMVFLTWHAAAHFSSSDVFESMKTVLLSLRTAGRVSGFSDPVPCVILGSNFFFPHHLLPIIGMMTSIVAGMCKVSTMCLFLLQELFQYLFTDSMTVTPISRMGRLIGSSRIQKVILDHHW